MSIINKQISTILVLLIIAIVIFFLSGCLTQDSSDDDITSPQNDGVTSVWMDIELIDVATGETFRISDFKGKPVLIESFAVWCPTCLQQQKQIEELRSSEGDSIIHISLDTDPNEDENSIREHIETNGFDWYYAVSPINLTLALIDEFGQTVVFAPGAPVVLVCEDGSARLLRNGVKSADELLIEVEKGC